MKTYEYKHVQGTPNYVTSTLNNTSKEGWEVCGFAAFPDHDVIALVKREVTEDNGEI